MPESPSQFLKKYKPVTFHSLTGTRYVNVSAYRSGEPRKKKFRAAAFSDFRRFLTKKGRYRDGKNGADRHHWTDSDGLSAFGLIGTSFFVPWLRVEITWKELQLGFYGKGTPPKMRKILQVVDYYLHMAEVDLKDLHWGYKMDIEEYAQWYLGIDCNGFAGAYLETYYPTLGVHGNYHINYWDSKMKKRDGLDEIQPGDVLSREGGGGTRHVAMIDRVQGSYGPGSDSRRVTITQSANSLGGLDTQDYTLKKRNSSPAWDLVGYYRFDHCLAPIKK